MVTKPQACATAKTRPLPGVPFLHNSTMTLRRSIPGLSSALQRGDLVFLRHPTGRDKAAYIKLREASEAHLFPWEPRDASGEPPAHDELFDRVLSSADTESTQRMLICSVADGTIAGQVSLNQIFRGPFLSCMAGYWIGSPFTRRGYMTQALQLACKHAFETLKLHRVQANIIPTNKPSRALVQKLGFRFEGLAKRYLQIAGQWQDHEHWALTSEEFTPHKSRGRKPSGRPSFKA